MADGEDKKEKEPRSKTDPWYIITYERPEIADSGFTDRFVMPRKNIRYPASIRRKIRSCYRNEGTARGICAVAYDKTKKQPGSWAKRDRDTYDEGLDVNENCSDNPRPHALCTVLGWTGGLGPSIALWVSVLAVLLILRRTAALALELAAAPLISVVVSSVVLG